MGVDDVRVKVQRYLQDIVDRFEIIRGGDFSFRFGSAQIFVFVDDWGDGDTRVKYASLVIQGVTPSPELFEHIAKTGYAIGALRAEEAEGLIDVYLEHTALGETLDPREFELALILIARTADELDDELQQRFGGTRYHED